MKEKNHSSLVKIGVLGGIGPEATGNFYNKLISELQKRGLIKSNADFPQIIINSIPAPELIYEKHSDSDIEPYIEGLKTLEKHNPDFIIMVCNTIHFFYDKLQKKISVPIIDLRKEVYEYLKMKQIKSVMVIGSPTTIRRGLYKYENINYAMISDNDIEKLTDSVDNYNKGFRKQEQTDAVKKMVNGYLKRERDAVVILGCTELALMLNDAHIPKLDPMGVLMDSAIKRFVAIKNDRKI